MGWGGAKHGAEVARDAGLGNPFISITNKVSEF